MLSSVDVVLGQTGKSSAAQGYLFARSIAQPICFFSKLHGLLRRFGATEKLLQQNDT